MLVTPLRIENIAGNGNSFTTTAPFRTSGEMWYATQVSIKSEPHVRNILGCVHEISKASGYTARSGSDSIVLDLYTDSGGAPGSLIASGSTPMDSVTSRFVGSGGGSYLPARGYDGTGTMSGTTQYLYGRFASPVAGVFGGLYWVVVHTASNSPYPDVGGQRQFLSGLQSYAGATVEGMVGTSLSTLAAISGRWALNVGLVVDFTPDVAWAWGENARGTLGIGDTGSPAYPIDVLAPTTIVAADRGSVDGMLFLSDTGTVYFAGDNAQGGFGNGSAVFDTQQSPVLVGRLSAITKIVQGDCCYALDTAGNLWGWGSQANGALASAVSATLQTTPGIIATNVADFDSNGNTTIVLHADGTVEGVGLNSSGELGRGNTSSPYTNWQPISVPGKTITQVVAGSACLLLGMADGTVYAAGNNPGGSGQLGATAGSTNSTFFALPYTNSVDLWTGANVTFSLRSNGTISGMGTNANGELGSGRSSGIASSPQTWLSPFPAGVTLSQIARGHGGNAFAVSGSDGLVYTWGWGGAGAMGDNTYTVANPTPASLNGLTRQAWVGSGWNSIVSSSGLIRVRRSASRMVVAVGPSVSMLGRGPGVIRVPFGVGVTKLSNLGRRLAQVIG